MPALNGELHWVKGRFNYSYIIVEEYLVIVDIDFPSNVPKILSYVKSELKRPISDIKLVIATHWHLDHINGIDKFVSETNAELAVHPFVMNYYLGKDKIHYLSIGEIIRSVEFEIIEKFPFPNIKDILTMPRAGIPLPLPLITNRRIKTEIKCLLEDGQPVPYCEGWKVIFAPGHTRDSITLYNEKNKALIAGDLYIHRGGEIRQNTDVLIWDKSYYLNSISYFERLNIQQIFPAFGGPIMNI